MLSLPDVTLVCVTTIAHELHKLAADECLKHAQFGDVITEMPHGNYRQFFFYDLPRILKTSHMLAIQWDSWIINPDAWTDEFLNYDFVGAPWWYEDELNVGNSGFSLQSKRLMEFIAEHPDEFPIKEPWDHVLCREYQPRLPQFKWAPSDLAWRFSVERTGKYESIPFGFHGLFHFPRVLGAEALDERLSLASKDPYITSKPEWQEVRRCAA